MGTGKRYFPMNRSEAKGEEQKMEHFRALGRARRALYIAAALLPIISLGLYFAVCGLPVPGVAWVFLVPPAPGFLLGAANLALILTGHPPRENRALWEALLLLSLLAALALLGFDLLMLAFFLS